MMAIKIYRCARQFFVLLGGYIMSAVVAEAASPIKTPVFNCVDTKPRSDFVNFESGQVRPLALSPDGKLLFVANTPANCLEIYSVAGEQLQRVSAVQVGLEPVAVAARNNYEVWVVNHLSDSVSIVDISSAPYVKRTLQVGDEPRDIVFAGTRTSRAFITTAHRGQNHSGFALEDLRKPGIGRADVWVFDGDKLDSFAFSGGKIKPTTILSLFTDTPRSLAVSADKKTVYAAGFLSGNKTTVMDEFSVDHQQPLPNTDINGAAAPRLALIIKHNGSAWVDESGKDWSEKVMLSLPDKDVFMIDADADTPKIKRAFSGVGTVLFNMAVNPVTGSIYVSNTEAHNFTRFEGPGSRSTTVRGRTVDNRITVIKNNSVTPVHLNPHIDFSLPIGAPTPADQKAKSIAQPQEIQISNDGSTAYVAAFGSSKIAVIPTRELETNSYQPNSDLQINVPGGPAGILLNASGSKLYVYSRFDNKISVIDTASRQLVTTKALYNPEPEYIVKGRPFLYDANKTSGNGTGSCSSCHVYGDLDSLAWDLGNPDEGISTNPLQPSPGNLAPLNGFFHPLKGPMTTQTLRGIADSGPMHWRGDRTGTNPVVVNGQLETQAAAAFKEFNKAFVGLVGREQELSLADMQLFTDYALSIQQPPNPIRNLDNSLTPAQANGKFVYFNKLSDAGFVSCNGCHALNPEKRQFGTEGLMVNSGGVGAQEFKVPHLRGLYQKVGMFGGTTFQVGGAPVFAGDQVRGFGFQHDGNVATIDDFVQGSGAFTFETPQDGFDVADFLMVYDTNHSPITGQQVSLSASSTLKDISRLKLLIQQAVAGRCNLEANGFVAGLNYNGRYVGGRFVSDISAVDKKLAQGAFTNLGGAITYTCKPVVN